MTTAAVLFRGVRKSYGAQQVLRGLDYTVETGEIYAFVGSNGAGKTTSIKSLLDFCAIDAGDIAVFGVAHTEPRARERLAFLPERFVPPYFLTGHEYLRALARLYGTAYAVQPVAALSAALELGEEALGRPVRTYSKGMAQKLGLIGVLASERELLVLDEPLSGLDARARILVKRELERVRDHGRTVFFTSHMLADVEALCQRVGILNDGRMLFSGEVDECIRRFGGPDLESAYLNAVESGRVGPA